MAVDLVGAGAGAKSHQQSHWVGGQNGGSGAGAKSHEQTAVIGSGPKMNLFLLHHLPIKEQLNN
jgi:hypothetical protein